MVATLAPRELASLKLAALTAVAMLSSVRLQQAARVNLRRVCNLFPKSTSMAMMMLTGNSLRPLRCLWGGPAVAAAMKRPAELRELALNDWRML